MLERLLQNWWTILLRGALALLFGIAAFLLPSVTITALVLLFGVYLIVDGILALLLSFAVRPGDRRWWLLLLNGVLAIAAGLITFVWPAASALALVLIVAAWALVTGVIEILAAARLRRELSNEWLLGVGGLVTVALGIALVLAPSAGLVAASWLFGAFALIYGVLMISLGLRLHSLHTSRRSAHVH